MTARSARSWRRAARNRSAGGAGMYTPQRRKLLADLTGTVLEIGPGAGANATYFPRDVRWLGLEPNPYLHDRLREQAKGEVIGGTAEEIPLADHSVDAVVGTIVLCSVEDQHRVLAEIVRVLRPGGRYVFLEHVAAPEGTWSRRAQQAVAPVSRWLDGGCDPARETGRAIDAAGFERVETEEFLLHGPFGVKIPHLTGWAGTAR
ncbi:class I SAM-dependent methyltransferase [Amycolatopsis magusensis]|uniref:Ubiquinone/menaquinone biosynthesis C-methylase UbiE n=1 Tax=Amycolatopsis magusensis TaxID=882444 RepID=A0ABS4PPK4_9PSEU|nr:class I SAM-dependent methyltransferase [Amycolatopsis magusensis]MBP2181360.1 ubiquinone/menaquinone biosynthesis C-methylase UbiE [Amycolatopsis magusensis]